MLKGKGLFALLTILFLAGCQGSVEDQLKGSKSILEEPSTIEVAAPNESTEGLSFHLPSNVKIIETSPSNIILEGNNQTYIVFFNPFEDEFSKSLYEEEKSRRENVTLSTVKETDEGYYYSFIDSIEDDRYRIIIGRGGVKVTTESSGDTILSSVKTMVTMLRSSDVSK
ncbi:hypothetical protein [Mangrovibacillus cuniculi]|uniref:DUF4367 domain-containing protein n=1 Tax=Mangrovibacillus cuniculi TaxID=2593652 RepID=A0A7S8CC63_9BACI|nr:hypothetical protein [Mangrovibacillus cuniculi]QPC47268.1 hypothetical protein G8O30_09930 [Mangrovibacillus cuniculi]